MAESDTLFALAEIAVAIAGFSAVVVLFKRSDSGRWLASDADRFHGMLLHAMSAAFFCILPSLIAVFTSVEGRVWAISSAVLGLQILGHSIIIFRLPSTGTAARVALVFALAAFVLQALNTFGIVFAREFRPYLFGVLWHLCQAGMLFIYLVWVRDSDVEKA